VLEASQRQYFERRAAEERAAAAQAHDERAAQPHRELARRYDDMVNGEVDGAEGEDMPDLIAGLPPEFRILP
jgi:hypothetical protein